jgi:hypothetical protein
MQRQIPKGLFGLKGRVTVEDFRRIVLNDNRIAQIAERFGGLYNLTP